jgi:arsenate reductase
MLTLYAYKNCDTCRKAVKWLKENAVAHETKAIRETPPMPAELEAALAALNGDLRKLFNTSGTDYRDLGLKDKLPALSKSEAIALLAENGNLVKRPFLISEKTALVGFNEAAWTKALG